MNLTRRRCLVCDEKVDVLEPDVEDPIGLACTACGAPTERVAVLKSGFPPKSAHAVALGRLGGLKGGRARAEVLTPQRRLEIARRAAQARWAGRQRIGTSPAEGRGPFRPVKAARPFVGTSSPQQLVRRYYRLFNDRRLDEAEQLVDPEASFYYVPTKQRLIGRAGYRALVTAWLVAFPDARVSVTVVRQVDDETVRLEFKGRGTHTGDLVLGDRLTLTATRRATSLVFHNTLTVRNGQITGVQFDFDVRELRKRLSE